MHRSLHHAMLLGQGGGLEDFARGLKGNRFRFEAENVATALLIVAGIAAAVGIVSYLLILQQRRRGSAGPLRLFFSLCRAHKLRWSQRWLLWRVARAQRLRDPALLFLEPERLAAAPLGPAFEPHQAQLSQIRDRLFGRLGEEKEQSESPTPVAPDRRRAGAEVFTALPQTALEITFQAAGQTAETSRQPHQ